MIKLKALFLLLLAASIGFVSTQDIYKSSKDALSTTPLIFDATEGSMYRHIYSTAVYYTTDTDKSTLAINKTMIVGLFDSTETINYATGKNFIKLSSYSIRLLCYRYCCPLVDCGSREYHNQ